MNRVDQVDLAVWLQLGKPRRAQGHGAILRQLDNIGHIDAGIVGGVNELVKHILPQHHEVRDGLADDGVERDQNGQGQKAPQASAHGVEALFLVELLHFLLHF